MTDTVFFLGVALLFGYFWVAAPNATYRQRLERATIMAVVIGLIIATS